MKRTCAISILAIAAMLMAAIPAVAQVTGEVPPASPPTTAPPFPQFPTGSAPPDTLFIFTPVAPLIDTLRKSTEVEDLFGIDVLFSNSGFGGGAFYQRKLGATLSLFANLGVTGSRTKDELDEWNGYEYRVPNKVNRLYTFPLMIGVRQRLFAERLSDEFRPFLNAGVGPSLVLTLPYEYSFFSSFGHAAAHLTAGGFVGIGADFGEGDPVIGANLRYYIIPISPGIESLKNEPITDFGGLFLTLNISFP
ncbi:MAG: hypothetical protein DYG96_05235 [Chlorobi bacterium CHB2]|nr:hypothetical protein [Chlorobi bacterium CHB2]